MRSIKANLVKEIQKNPNVGMYVLLGNVVRGRDFSMKSVTLAFNKFVPKSDYDKNDKKKLLAHLFKLSVEGVIQG